MKRLQKLNRLDLFAGIFLIVLALFSVGLMAYTSWVGISVRLHTTNPLNQIGPYETITLVFSQPVRPNEVENQLQLQPADAGRLDWQNDHTLRIIPNKPHPGTLSIRLLPGKLGENDEWMRLDASWTLTVRQPSIVYLNYAEPKNELMVIPATGGSPRQLTSTGGKIVDFGISRSGDSLVYSVANNQKGLDLWLVDRNGQNARRLLDCGPDQCHTPAWSPNDLFIAYNREQPLPNTGEGSSSYGASRPWVFNIETTENHPVFSDSQATGTGALWSPDGNWLASYDSTKFQIRIVNLESAQQVLLPSLSNQLGSWSPDSNSFIHPDYVMDAKGNIVENFLTITNIKTGQTKTLLVRGSDAKDYRYGGTSWAPSGNQIALSMLSTRRHEIPRLWVFQIDQPENPIMTAAPDYSYDFYKWDMQGTGLLVQQTSITKAYLYEIATWHPSQGYRVVGKDGFLPHWLP